MCVRGLLLSVLELLLWALPCIVVLAVLLFTECTFVSSFLCSFAFELLLIATVPPPEVHHALARATHRGGRCTSQCFPRPARMLFPPIS